MSTRTTRRSTAAAAANAATPSSNNTDDPQSTGSVLGELIKDFDLDRDLPLIENLDPDNQQQQQQLNIVGGEQQELQLTTNHVNNLDLKQEFLLVDDVNQTTTFVGNGDGANPQINFTITPQIPTTAGAATGVTAGNNLDIDTKEGEQIMTSLHGFGQMSVGAPFADNNGAAVAGSPNNNQMMQQQQQAQQQQQLDYSAAYVKILEQPLENKLRFRYECEGRSAGTMHGQGSTAENKTYPTIQIVGYQGPAVCVVSLVEHNSPYRAHPNNLVGRDGLCKKGVCSVEITNPNMTYQFQNLGIQCVRKKDAPASLEQRKEIRVDPFKQGFDHKNAAIDLNQVRLCFQVFLKTPSRSLIPLRPVVSSILKDRKAHADLGIIEYSDDRSPVEGGKKILLFCEKISRDDIEVHFTQYTKGGEQITAKGEFAPTDVHKQFGICLKTPPYVNRDITSPVKCSMYLYKPKSKASSEPVDFYYVPAAGVMDIKPPLPVGQRGMHYNNTPHQQANKRGRAPRHSPDENSSGQVAVPSKQPPPQPEVLRQSGGTAILVGGQSPSPNNDLSVASPPMQQQMYAQQQASPYDQMTVAYGSPNDGAGGNQADSQMTKDLQTLLQQNDFVAPQQQQHIFQQPPRPVATTASTVPNQQQQDPSTVNASGGASSSMLQDFLQTAGITTNDQGGLPNLSLESGDIMAGAGTEMDNLSENLDSNLKLQHGGGGGSAAAGSKPKNDLDADMPPFFRQSSQLHTPDVSSMSVDGGASGAMKRPPTTVNKF